MAEIIAVEQKGTGRDRATWHAPEQLPGTDNCGLCARDGLTVPIVPCAAAPPPRGHGYVGSLPARIVLGMCAARLGLWGNWS